jgi:1-pyrroline-5-carboxylate dehydrogenase
LWGSVATNLRTYRAYPRLVGETGGKDFVVAHPSADIEVLRVALVRGAFEYQGQKCSAASRAYVPQSLWSKLRSDLVDEIDSLPMGDVTDFTNFMGAVIDDRSFQKLSSVIDRVRGEAGVEIVAGGQADDSEGYFVRPTVVQADDPNHEVFTTEYFGPILGVFVYDDADYDRVLRESAAIGPYGLTGSIIAQDRNVIVEAMDVLRFAAGNFYMLWGSSPLVVRGRAGLTTRPAPSLTCSAGYPLARSRNPSCRRPTTVIRTWDDRHRIRPGAAHTGIQQCVAATR